MDDQLQPLEQHLKKLVRSTSSFPDRNGNYWERYTGLVAGLRQYVYPNINAGLACLSKSPGIYTDHGGSHFDEVVRYAGLLLSNPEKNELHGLEPYEIYLLLCAIRLHDAGNIEGREKHERKAADILEKYGGNIVHDTPEFELISAIAEAHGGSNPITGDKDTIGALPVDDTPMGPISCRPRQVAAIVRFADEICEHRSRAATHHITSDTMPEENKLFHLYAESITGAVPDRKTKTFKLQLRIKIEYLMEQYLTPQKVNGTESRLYLMDEVLNRLEKLDRERMYCNKFLDPRLQTDRLFVSLRLVKSETNRPVQVLNKDLVIPSPTGYPEPSTSWRAEYSDLTGEKLAARIKEEWHE